MLGKMGLRECVRGCRACREKLCLTAYHTANGGNMAKNTGQDAGKVSEGGATLGETTLWGHQKHL